MKKLNQFEQRYADAKSDMLTAVYCAKGECEILKAQADADNAHLRKEMELAHLRYKTDKAMAKLRYAGEELAELIEELKARRAARLEAIEAAIANNQTSKQLAEDSMRERVRLANQECLQAYSRIRKEEAEWERERKESGVATYGQVLEALSLVRKFCEQKGNAGIRVRLGSRVASVEFSEEPIEQPGEEQEEADEPLTTN